MKHRKHSYLIFSVLLTGLSYSGGAWSAPSLSDTKYNQLGFLPTASKQLVVSTKLAGENQDVLIYNSDGKVVEKTRVQPAKTWPFSNEKVHLVTLDSVSEKGDYRAVIANNTVNFAVADNVYDELLNKLIKSYYFNRSNTALEKKYAGQWQRPMAFENAISLVHKSAAQSHRKESTKVHTPGAWFDAGDFNSYIVNSSITTYSLLAALHRFQLQNLVVDIPESNNKLPDLIDEVLWNLDWMLSMQDPFDGGVYHKMTTMRFAGEVMPEQVTEPRYLVMKTTAASLDFAATIAFAQRVLAPYQHLLGQRYSNLSKLAEQAYQWAKQFPGKMYQQPKGMNTGLYQYEDETLVDEWLWATTELYLTTADTRYLSELVSDDEIMGVPSWDNVEPLAWLSVIYHDSPSEQLSDIASKKVMSLANRLLAYKKRSAYGITMGAITEKQGRLAVDFSWGSNSVAANHGVVLLAAYHLTKDRNYLDAAQSNLDYLLGRNPFGISYVTGIGHKRAMLPHHRVSHSDGIVEPIPGMLVGGPHAGKQDQKQCPTYLHDLPAITYLDDWCSYATNEVAINWNAAMVYLVAGVNAVTENDNAN